MLNGLARYRRIAGLRGAVSAVVGTLTKGPVLVALRPPGVSTPVHLRAPSSDFDVFEQVFLGREYGFDVSRPPMTIVDAGANIGLASVYFASRFPAARVIAIEPETGNFELLRRNVAPYPNVTPVHAALWHEAGTISLVDPNLGNWGFMTRARDSASDELGRALHDVRAVTVDQVMREHGIEHLDLLKIDIEGAEREVFRDPSAWIAHVDTLIAELHERMKPGCSRSFYNGTSGFDAEWCHGENVYLTRSGGCVTPPLPSAPSA